ncbi:MAG TPA: hypothetical protein VN419_05980, partial [Humidesulfovibrio sp.]|uniref:hypothetical protein n=1 Tax=Humidesulfovibrio sp. TaxID=2910988 RepID=UPI002C2E0EEB
MRQTLKNQERLFDVDEALEDLKTRRPAMADIATSYALLQKARLEAVAALPKASLPDAEPVMADLAHGRPLLAALLENLEKPGEELVARFRVAAKIILPQAAQAFPKLAQDMARLAVLLDSTGSGKDEGAQLAAALLAG